MITGAKLIGTNINVPKEYYDYEYKGAGSGLTSSSVGAILNDINNSSVFEKTWRIINLSGQAPITDGATYKELTDKGFIIYGETSFNEFIVEIQTSGSFELVELPVSAGVFSATVDWGDGTVDSLSSHTYSEAGIYEIAVDGTMTVINTYTTSFTSQVRKVLSWGTTGLTSISFRGCSNLTEIATDFIGSFSSVINFNSFMRGTGITSIPNGIFNYAVNATYWIAAFSGSPLTGQIPLDLFNNCAKLQSVEELFYGCSSMASTIPQDFVKYCPDLSNFKSVFFNCHQLYGEIPVDLFKYNPSLIWAGEAGNYFYSGTFTGCSNLTGTIPQDLFKHNPLLRDTSYLLRGCTGLTGSIPDDFFRYNTNIEYVMSTFFACTGLTGSIPQNLLKYNTLLINTGGLFYGCTGLTGSIPVDFLRYNTELTRLNETYYDYGLFGGCTGLTGTIPNDLLRYNTKLVEVNGLLRDCTGLTGSIPQDLFKYNINLISVGQNHPSGRGVFSGCSGLTGTIPADLLRYNTQLVNAPYLFDRCTGLTGTIPQDLFRYNTLLTDVTACFSYTNLDIDSDIFNYNISVSSLIHTFIYCTSTSTIPSTFAQNTALTNATRAFRGSKFTGNAPDLWNTFPSAIGSLCFNGCTFDNQASIPAGWK